MLKKFILSAFILILGTLGARAQQDTLFISTDYTSHVIFPTDLTYADLSNSRYVIARIIEKNKNMMALKAREAFTGSCSVSALESNGTMHTFIVVYEQFPREFVVDLRKRTALYDDSRSGRGQSSYQGPSQTFSPTGENVSTWKSGSAPLLQDVINYKQTIYHIGEREFDIQVLCEDIFAYSDITYIILSLRNNSGISYTISDASFVRENKNRRGRKVAQEGPVFPRSRYGSLSAGPGEYTRIVYSFDKMSLYKNQVIRVYFYEEGGQRNLVLNISAKDINKARSAMK